MTTSLKAHFDGKVFVPDEPVPVPAGTPAEIRVSTAESNAEKTRRAKIRKELVALCGEMNGGVGRRTWTRDDLYER